MTAVPPREESTLTKSQLYSNDLYTPVKAGETNIPTGLLDPIAVCKEEEGHQSSYMQQYQQL